MGHRADDSILVLFLIPAKLLTVELPKIIRSWGFDHEATFHFK